ncbi:hypothetical protein BX666DRAFT_7679 [Dichotomocladium elegans]|nr:hypothetical protein BX666DRAFT_7679 [Dichotomocladium elegans]
MYSRFLAPWLSLITSRAQRQIVAAAKKCNYRTNQDIHLQIRPISLLNLQQHHPGTQQKFLIKAHSIPNTTQRRLISINCTFFPLSPSPLHIRLFAKHSLVFSPTSIQYTVHRECQTSPSLCYLP